MAPSLSTLRGPQIWRIQQLLEWLKRGEQLTTRLAAERFEVSQRTIATDIGHLRQFGVPIAYEAAKYTYRLTEPFDHLPTNVLTRTDYTALLVASHALAALGDSLDARTLEHIIERLAEILPEDLLARAKEDAGLMKVDAGPRARRPSHVLDALRVEACDQPIVATDGRIRSVGC